MSPGSVLTGRVAAAELGPQAFIPQDVAFFAHLTVAETLTLAAQLRRGRATDLEHHGGTDAVSDEVAAVLHRLGLSDVAHTLVGGDAGGRAVPGISGGERRRLAIACETAGTPQHQAQSSHTAPLPRIVFADEPTAGLDAFHADRVVDALSTLARGDGCCVVCVIHQPRSASFARLDDIMLLAPGGRVAYTGPTAGGVVQVSKCGFPCPPQFNPAEWLVDLVSIDTTAAQREAETQSRCTALCDAWEAQQRKALPPPPAEQSSSAAPAVHDNGKKPAAPLGPFSVFGMLLRRAWRVASRDVWVNSTRLVASLVLGFAFGGMHHNLGKDQPSVARRASLLMQCCINTAFLAMVKSLNGFPRERAVVQREVARGTGPGCGGYSVVPYFLAKLCVDAPLDALFPLLFGGVTAHLAGLNPQRRGQLLGTLALQGLAASSLGLSVSALAPSTEAALALGPCLMVFSIMLADSGGVFAEVPPPLRPLAKLSIVKWGFEGAMGAEFPGLKFDTAAPMPPPAAQTEEEEDGKGKKPADKQGRQKRNGPPRRLFNLGIRDSAAAAASRAAAEAMSVRDGEAVLTKMGLPRDGGVGRAATAQMRAVAINLGATLLALMISGKWGSAGKKKHWEGDAEAGKGSAGFERTTLGVLPRAGA